MVRLGREAMNISVLVHGPAFGLYIPDALATIGNVKLFSQHPSDFRLHKTGLILDNLENRDEARWHIEKSELIFIAGAISIECLSLIAGNNWLKWAKKLMGQIVLYGIDSPYWRNPAYYNGIATELKALLFLMPNLMGVARRPSIPLFMPQKLNLGPKDEAVKIVHSPGRAVKMEIKGTGDIEAAVNELKGEGLNFIYRRLTGATWTECLSAKSIANIVIDQLPPPGHVRGLGSSGLEGLAAGCAVLTDTSDHKWTQDYFEYPPVFPAHNKDELKEQLRNLITDKERRENLGKQGTEWIKDNLEFEPWTKYLKRFI